MYTIFIYCNKYKDELELTELPLMPAQKRVS